jgi:hypothetical protein
MTRFIKVKTADASEIGTYPARFSYINLDAIVEVEQYGDDHSRCRAVFQANHCQTIIMPADALIAIIERK